MARSLFRPAAGERAVWYRFDTASGTNTPAVGSDLGEAAEARSDFNTGALPQFLGPEGVTTLYPKRLTGPRGSVVSVGSAVTGFDPNPASAASGSATSVTVNGVSADETGDIEIGLRGDVVYLWDSGTSTYNLAAGQSDDGVSPRCYRGGASGAPEAQVGYAARAGDWQIVTT